MEIIVDKRAAFSMFDALVERWREKSYPFNRPDAIIPQTRLPKDLRSDPHVLACFYFYACIYMRGGIESLQAFAALVKMWREHPDLFDPLQARKYSEADVAAKLKRFIGWDSQAASKNWVTNSVLLCESWGGNPLNLLRGLRSYEESCRRMRNKRTERESQEAGLDGRGFRGFQYKMVSMLLYFYDWEGWLPRFMYPSPADFHNFRLAFATGAMRVKGLEGNSFTINDRVSRPWRDTVMQYLRARNSVTPVELADALWLYSLVLCGSSPFTKTEEVPVKLSKASLFEHGAVEETWLRDDWIVKAKRKLVRQTCGVCLFQAKCSFAIPAQPYYRKGKFVLRPRKKLEQGVDARLVRDPRPSEVVVAPEVATFLS